VFATHSVVSVPGGTRATLALHYEGALGALMGRLTQAITNRYFGLEAAGLKTRSESRSRESAQTA
jgi:hypothetical protein